jgi:hypothetical protein
MQDTDRLQVANAFIKARSEQHFLYLHFCSVLLIYICSAWQFSAKNPASLLLQNGFVNEVHRKHIVHIDLRSV